MPETLSAVDWSLFGKVIYINLNARNDRNALMEAQLKRLGVPQEKIHRLDAIPHRVEHIRSARSHAKAMELAITHNWGNVVVLEDDFSFNESTDTETQLAHLISTLGNIQWTGVILSGNYLEATPLKSTSAILRINKAEDCVAYAVNATYQPLLYQNLTESIALLEKGGRKDQFAHDVYWWKLFDSHSWLAANPSLGRQCPHKPDIEDSGSQASLATPVNGDIPKIIHIIWIGDESRRPDNLIQTWRDNNPTWVVRLWGNKEFRKTKWINQRHMNAKLALKEYAAVTDMMRYEILFEHGGFYVDADSVCMRPLAGWLFDSQINMSMENETCRSGLIANTYIASEPKSPLLYEIIESIRENPDVPKGEAWLVTGPMVVTNTVNRLKYRNITLWPSHYFLPEHFTGENYLGSHLNVFARHVWGTTRNINDALVTINV